jgi:hypothetical protein
MEKMMNINNTFSSSNSVENFQKSPSHSVLTDYDSPQIYVLDDNINSFSTTASKVESAMTSINNSNSVHSLTNPLSSVSYMQISREKVIGHLDNLSTVRLRSSTDVSGRNPIHRSASIPLLESQNESKEMETSVNRSSTFIGNTDITDEKKNIHRKHLSNFFGKNTYESQDGQRIKVSLINTPLEETSSHAIILNEQQNRKRAEEKYKFAIWILQHGGLKNHENKYLWPIFLLQDATKNAMNEAAQKLTEIQNIANAEGDAAFALGVSFVKHNEIAKAQEWLKKAKELLSESTLPKDIKEKKVKEVTAKLEDVKNLEKKKNKAQTYYKSALDLIKIKTQKEHEANALLEKIKNKEFVIADHHKRIIEKEQKGNALLEQAAKKVEEAVESHKEDEKSIAEFWIQQANVAALMLKKEANEELNTVKSLKEKIDKKQGELSTLIKEVKPVAIKLHKEANETLKMIHKLLHKADELGHPYAHSNLETIGKTESKKAKATYIKESKEKMVQTHSTHATANKPNKHIAAKQMSNKKVKKHAATHKV